VNIKIDPASDTSPVVLPENLGFGQIFSRHMYIQKYSPDKGWHDAVIGPYGPLSMAPASAVLHYGQEIFEGTKAYRRPDGHINLFRPWENAARFNRSAKRMAMQEVDPESHVDAIAQLVAIDHAYCPPAAAGSLYIRPTLIAADSTLGVTASKTYLHYVILSPSALLRPGRQARRRLHLGRVCARGAGRHRRGQDRRQLRGQPVCGGGRGQEGLSAGAVAGWHRTQIR
jgi:branched-chain amino acid aminotransferase